MLNTLTRYFADHWNGDQGLAWSFWINFVAMRLALFIGQSFALPDKGTDYSDKYWIIIALIFFLHGAVFVWQSVGLLRAADKYARDTGSQAHAWGAQICLAVFVFLTFSAVLEAWQSTIPVSTEENHLVRMDREHASKYVLELNADTKTLSITGNIELGITRNLRALLKDTNSVNYAILTSSGGNIYEARGLAKIFRDFNINTHVETTCSSACTSAFAGGKMRSMNREAKIGFHQYRIDSKVRTINADPQAEQERDKELFKASGVSEAFVEQIFLTPPDQMWFPSAEQLLQAGYVHQIK